MVHILEDIEHYAEENNVPIMQKEGIEFLKDYIEKNNIVNILEIGTAIGYSAIKMCINKNIMITTIERDKKRFEIALKNIKKVKLEDQITIINDDAFNIDLKDKFDLIFIDAAKGQYIKFFEKFEKNLNRNGTIISDNLYFHGLTKQIETIKSRNLRQLVRKINKYVDFITNHPYYDTKIYNIGDGIGVTRRKNE
ncbi:MAG: O-methyltransferase [Clostridium sp.]|nr:O-methyltransferase [Clostridium sp.]MCM1444120.1 O-methyltransferase [Candidatus Amulumruptor caecigallinarius]